MPQVRPIMMSFKIRQCVKNYSGNLKGLDQFQQIAPLKTKKADLGASQAIAMNSQFKPPF